MLPALKEVMIKGIDPVQRRIDETAKNVEQSLCNYLQTCKFLIQLNESTNEALLLSYFIKDGKYVKNYCMLQIWKCIQKEKLYLLLCKSLCQKGSFK